MFGVHLKGGHIGPVLYQFRPELGITATQDVVVFKSVLYLWKDLLKANKYMHRPSPWTTTGGVIKSIELRDDLYKKLKTCATDSPEYKLNHYNLKMYGGYLKQCIRAAKALSSLCVSQIWNDIRKTWDTLKATWNQRWNFQPFSSHYTLSTGKHMGSAKISWPYLTSTSLKEGLILPMNSMG